MTNNYQKMIKTLEQKTANKKNIRVQNKQMQVNFDQPDK